MSEKKVIVTGATGQDGSYMCEYLLENTENTVIAGVRRTSKSILDNLKNILDHPRFKIVTVDLCDPHSIKNLIQLEAPDYFLNFGAQTFVADSWTSPALHMQTNAVSLIHILESIKEYAPECRVYSAGSSEQFGDVDYSPQDENHPYKPRSIYGVSKCTADNICKIYRESYGMHVTHSILFNHESERRQLYFVTRKITSEVARIKRDIDYGMKGKISPLKIGNILSKRDWSHSKDFMEAVWLMVNQPKPKKYVLSSNETHTVKEFIEICFKKIGINIQWWSNIKNQYISDEELVKLSEKELLDIRGVNSQMNTLVEIDEQFFRPCEVNLLHGDSSLARKELGWEPKYSFEELVDEMITHDLNLI